MPDRELTLKAASELTKCSVRKLRALIHDGRLRATGTDPNRLTVSLLALRESGLLDDLLTDLGSNGHHAQDAKGDPVVVDATIVEPTETVAESVAEPVSEAEPASKTVAEPATQRAAEPQAAPAPTEPPPQEPAREPTQLSAAISRAVGPEVSPWITAAQMHDLMRHVLAEREAAGTEWKERAESLYREMIDEQRARVRRLEDENRELTDQLQDALRKIPQVLDYQTLEESARRQQVELERNEMQRQVIANERDRLRDLLDRFKAELSRAERRNLDMAEAMRRLRARSFWERLRGGDTGPRES